MLLFFGFFQKIHIIGKITLIMTEKIFPNTEFAKNAYFKSFEEYQKLYDYSMNHYEDFWASQARKNLTFFEDFTEVLDEKNFPKVEWFKN